MVYRGPDGPYRGCGRGRRLLPRVRPRRDAVPSRYGEARGGPAVAGLTCWNATARLRASKSSIYRLGARPNRRNAAAGLPNDTDDRILAGFLRVAAAAAGVNEVTFFRHLGDQASLARAAVRRFSPAEAIATREPAIDASSVAAAAKGLRRALEGLRAHIRTRPDMLVFGFGESHRFPELLPDLMATPTAVHGFLRRALAQAEPTLRARSIRTPSPSSG